MRITRSCMSGWPRWTWPRRPGWCACAPRTRSARAGTSTGSGTTCRRPGRGSPSWAAELLRGQVQMVTLESTSDYWRVWYYVLESIGLAVQLVSASQAKNLKGRPKTDKLDAMWLGPVAPGGGARAAVL